MIQSTELKDLILQWYAGLSSDFDPNSADRLFSKQPGFIAIGSEPDEWWIDSAIIKNRYLALTQAGEIDVEVRDLEAYCEGTVGWVVTQVVYRLASSVEIPIRQSFILHQENGEWKVVHAHGSVGVHSEDIGV